jgi:hypothetical protein
LNGCGARAPLSEVVPRVRLGDTEQAHDERVLDRPISVEMKPWQRGSRSNPLRHRARHPLFQAGSRSIDIDAGTGRFACDLRDGGSDAHSSEAGWPEFEVEAAAVGLAVACNRIFFVNGEYV